MAVTAQSSTEYTNQTSTPAVYMESNASSGKLRFQAVTFTQSGAGDATSTVDLIQLPPGSVRVLGALSRLDISAFGTSRTLDIGWTAYTDRNGDAVVADANGLDAALNVAAASTVGIGSAITEADQKLFESRGGVVLQATVAGGTIPDAATIKGYIVYVVE